MSKSLSLIFRVAHITLTVSTVMPVMAVGNSVDVGATVQSVSRDYLDTLKQSPLQKGGDDVDKSISDVAKANITRSKIASGRQSLLDSDCLAPRNSLISIVTATADVAATVAYVAGYINGPVQNPDPTPPCDSARSVKTK